MISIIAPVFNTKEQLPEMVESVLKQTCGDWELILVDDGSTDGCVQMCDGYAASDSRIRVVHQKNQGLSAARNTGLSIASGDYLQFLDSDDWLSPDALETLLDTISGSDADMVIFDVVYEWPDNSMRERQSIAPGIYEPELILKRLAEPSIPPYAANKFCRKSLYDGVFFPVGEKWEDVATVIYPVSRAEKIAVIDRALYHYRQRDEAITKQAMKDRSIHKWRFLQYTKRYEFLKANYPQIAEVARGSLVRCGIMYYSFCLRGREDKAERKRVLSIISSPEMDSGLSNTRDRLAWRAFCICPGLTAFLIRLRG